MRRYLVVVFLLFCIKTYGTGYFTFSNAALYVSDEYASSSSWIFNPGSGDFSVNRFATFDSTPILISPFYSNGSWDYENGQLFYEIGVELTASVHNTDVYHNRKIFFDLTHYISNPPSRSYYAKIWHEEFVGAGQTKIITVGIKLKFSVLSYSNTYAVVHFVIRDDEPAPNESVLDVGAMSIYLHSGNEPSPTPTKTPTIPITPSSTPTPITPSPTPTATLITPPPTNTYTKTPTPLPPTNTPTHTKTFTPTFTFTPTPTATLIPIYPPPIPQLSYTNPPGYDGLTYYTVLEYYHTTAFNDPHAQYVIPSIRFDYGEWVLQPPVLVTALEQYGQPFRFGISAKPAGTIIQVRCYAIPFSGNGYTQSEYAITGIQIPLAPTPTMTFTYTPTNTFTYTPTFTPTNTVALIATNTPVTPSYTPTKTNTPITPTWTYTRTNTPITPTWTSTPTFTPITPTWTPVIIATNTPITPTWTYTHTFTPIITPSWTPTSTFTPITPTWTPINTAIPWTPTNTPLAITTPVPPTITPTFTFTPTWTPIPPTNTPTWTPTVTYTFTWTPTNTFTFTPIPTNTFTPTFTRTFTPENTPIPGEPTWTPTNTYTPVTPSWTPTKTYTPTYTPITPTWTPTKTYTFTPTFTRTWTPTSTFTSTPTEMPNIQPLQFISAIPLEENQELVRIAWSFYPSIYANAAEIDWTTGEHFAEDSGFINVGVFSEDLDHNTIADYFILSSSYTIRGRNVETEWPLRESSYIITYLYMPTPTPTGTPIPTPTPEQTPTPISTPMPMYSGMVYRIGDILKGLLIE